MTINHGKPLPPDAVSGKVFVEKNWETIRRMTFDGYPTEGFIKGLDDYISARQALIDEGSLDQNFDWHQDLKAARHYHDWYKDFQPNNQQFRERQLEYWSGYTRRVMEYNEKISLAAFNTMTILHGAVAVGALNIISQKTPTNQAVVYAAKWAIPFSLIGIALLTLGQIIIFVVGSRIVHNIYNRLPANPNFIKIRSFARYIKRGLPAIKWGESLIYASIVWFFLYCFLLFFMIT